MNHLLDLLRRGEITADEFARLSLAGDSQTQRSEQNPPRDDRQAQPPSRSLIPPQAPAAPEPIDLSQYTVPSWGDDTDDTGAASDSTDHTEAESDAASNTIDNPRSHDHTRSSSAGHVPQDSEAHSDADHIQDAAGPSITASDRGGDAGLHDVAPTDTHGGRTVANTPGADVSDILGRLAAGSADAPQKTSTGDERAAADISPAQPRTPDTPTRVRQPAGTPRAAASPLMPNTGAGEADDDEYPEIPAFTAPAPPRKAPKGITIPGLGFADAAAPRQAAAPAHPVAVDDAGDIDDADDAGIDDADDDEIYDDRWDDQDQDDYLPYDDDNYDRLAEINVHPYLTSFSLAMFFPLGFVAHGHSIEAVRFIALSDPESAAEEASAAKGWSWAGIAVGLLCVTLAIVATCDRHYGWGIVDTIRNQLSM